MSYVPLSNQQKDEDQKKQYFKHRNHIFPSLRYPQPRPLHTLQSQINSSLFFQQLIYFNWYYSYLFVYLYSLSQIHRLIYFQIQFGVPVRIICGVAFIPLEIFRLRNGFYGNLKQSFPQIFAFMILTLITAAIQFILILMPNLPASPMQWSLLLYGLIFHVGQFVYCFFIMGKLTQAQKALFLWKNPLSYGAKK